MASYTKAVSYMHWLSAPAMLGCVGTVLQAQQVKGKSKGDFMFYHKSLGLLSGILVAPRLGAKLISKAPAAIEGSMFEQIAAKISHNALYIWMIVMPSTGIAMGYFGGKGLPFFYTTISGASTPNGDIAKNAFWIHKQAGVYGKYLIPLHLAGTAKHLASGQNILKRINPFSAVA
uniref:Cytochrome b561 bacterial/Ni-hydrogenase domain-containing protein n=1 Tax=Fibrocapsa japonica TaxID=94617 RepID=A0A7S2UZ64_9STRA|mmetsp:Transcript_20488/g.29665  ORF Transcript_20488/g.29665 Transcript_20488/m.29665 type:complete len:175 (+) Transcript_20488:104-628(+)|eukprot:CAMPEP_0113940918 /NCGR_PEP_ID=MMETSP1339-20121228/6938_1 /TAXON_ID=94617 /ORGANISM="Fibrocapsa japonica" /LENGTH=174 /DNA_ID=CAMNT_0000944895 /DNA_START=94 /DNA_END=618 /DNA_ORIENTATION=- /assembly_acc=CAM_ASM_000762